MPASAAAEQCEPRPLVSVEQPVIEKVDHRHEAHVTSFHVCVRGHDMQEGRPTRPPETASRPEPDAAKTGLPGPSVAICGQAANPTCSTQ